MHARTIVARGLSTGLRLGRGTADRVVSLAGPRIARLTDKVGLRAHPAEPQETTTFTPSRPAAATAAAPEGPRVAPEQGADGGTPSPASVARNVAPQRPTARQPRAAAARSGPKSVPGAKLPPRPSPS